MCTISLKTETGEKKNRDGDRGRDRDRDRIRDRGTSPAHHFCGTFLNKCGQKNNNLLCCYGVIQIMIYWSSDVLGSELIHTKILKVLSYLPYSCYRPLLLTAYSEIQCRADWTSDGLANHRRTVEESHKVYYLGHMHVPDHASMNLPVPFMVYQNLLVTWNFEPVWFFTNRLQGTQIVTCITIGTYLVGISAHIKHQSFNSYITY